MAETSGVRHKLSWFAPRWKLGQIRSAWKQELEKDVMNGFFQLLLQALGLLMIFAPFWRKSVRQFRGRYLFLSRDGQISTRVEFVPSRIFGTRMKVTDEIPPGYDPHVTLEFKDGRSLYAFLLSGGSDIFSALLDNRLNFGGNINYLLKFAYLSQHVVELFDFDGR